MAFSIMERAFARMRDRDMLVRTLEVRREV